MRGVTWSKTRTPGVYVREALAASAIACLSRWDGAAPTDEPDDVLAGVLYIFRHGLVRSIIDAQALSQASYQALILALPVFAFAEYRSSAIAGLLEGTRGAGALVGSILAVPVTARRPALHVARIAWVVQSMFLWLLVLPISSRLGAAHLLPARRSA
jgi:hypothetical protein